MEIKTKFNIGDKVYTLFESGIFEFEVIRIKIEVYAGHISIFYTVSLIKSAGWGYGDSVDIVMTEDLLHESPKALTDYLLKQINVKVKTK